MVNFGRALGFRVGIQAGDTSPLDQDQLAAMDVPTLVSFLQDWEPAHGWTEPTPEGLGQAIRRLTTDSTTDLSEHAELFAGIEPTYVRAMFEGAYQSLRQDQSVHWGPLLRLAAWVMDQDEPGIEWEGDRWSRDLDWRGTRKAIADLLEAGFDRDEVSPSLDHRSACWSLTEALLGDDDPTRFPPPRGDNEMDPATLSINSVRGAAVHAAVRYGVWVRRADEDAALTEMTTALESVLDLDAERRLATRAALGWELPALHWLDRAWVKSVVPDLFPSNNENADLWEAAWSGYISFNRPYPQVFDDLEEQYLCAARTAPAKGFTRSHDPGLRLAEHLMVLMWRGTTSWEAPHDLLSTFFREALPEYRAHALTFVGRSLRDTEEPIEDAVLGRLLSLWERRRQACVNGEPGPLVELPEFGWWYASGKLDRAWALEQLEWVLETAHGARPEHLVFERLQEDAEAEPQRAVRCAELLIDHDTEGWRIFGERGRIRRILEIALASSRRSTP